MTEQCDLFKPRQQGKTLRPRQAKADAAVDQCLKDYDSTLVVHPTGSGKTVIGTKQVKKFKGHVLWLAHMDQLLGQAKRAIESETGETVGMEKADLYAHGERVVVASIQTLSQPQRLERWPRDYFELVVCDEAHHATSQSWQRVLDHFGAKRLGLTATPNRHDCTKLGTVFDSVADVYEVDDAIRDGVLSPILVKTIILESVDFSRFRLTHAGDFHAEDMDKLMADEEDQKALHLIAKATIEESGDRRVLGFMPGVASSHALANICGRYRPGYARAVDGSMDTYDLRRTFDAHRRGEFQALVNCNLAVEGYDDPGIECLSMGRPTKSKPLLLQMVGRGLRPGKPYCLIVEFTSNCAKHLRPMSITDALGGKLPQAVVEAAERKVAEGRQQDPMKALNEAQAEAAEADRLRLEELAARRRVTAEVSYRVDTNDPFKVLHIRVPEDEWARRFSGKPASPKQVGWCRWKGIDVPKGATMQQVRKLMGACIVREKRGLASYQEVRELARYGITAVNWYSRNAQSALRELRAKGKVQPWMAAGHERQAGD